jgi:hypothetical protein
VKSSENKWSKGNINPLLIIILLVVIVGGVYLYSQNKGLNSVNPNTNNTLLDVSSRGVNEFFPNSIDNHSIVTVFDEKDTGSKQYKVVIEEVPYIQTKDLDVKAELSDRYYAAYGQVLAENQNDVSELYYNKLRTKEDVANVEKIIEHQYKNSMMPGYSLNTKSISGVQAWIVTNSDKSKRDYITLLFKENKILIDIRVGTNSKGSVENIAQAYVNFVTVHEAGSYISSENVLSDKTEAYALSQKRQEGIQRVLDNIKQN